MTKAEISIEQYEQLLKKLNELKKTEEELRKTKDILAEAQRIAHIGNWIWDIVNNTLEWSDEIYRIFGLKPQEFGATYEAFLNSVHPDDREFVNKSVDDALNKNVPYDINHRIVLPDSTERIVHEQAEITFAESGKPIRMLGTVQDITMQQNVEFELIRKNSLLNAINRVFQETLRSDMLKDVANTCLLVAEEITGSKFGFIGEINPDGRFDTIAISNPGWNACRMPETEATKLIKNMELRGIWSIVLKDEKSHIVNNPKSHPASVGTPDGHPKLTSFIGVPLKHAGKTFGLIALGNKEGGYDQYDQEIVEALSIAIVEAIMRKQAEIEITKYRDHLEDLIEKRTKKLKERIKEITCLYNISNLIQKSNISLEEIFIETLKFIPPAWQFPDVTCARISYKGQEFKTETFVESNWKQKADIEVKGETTGTIEIYHIKEIPEYGKEPFLKEEQDLIMAISKMLGIIIERKITEAALIKKDELNQTLLDSLPFPTMLIRKDRIILSANQIAYKLGAEIGELCWKSFAQGAYIPDKDKAYIDQHREIPPKGTQCYFCMADEVFKTLEPKTREIKAWKKIWDAHWVPIDNKRYLHYAIDITERIEFENLRRQFIYTVSHELRTPISVITQAITNIQKYREKLTDAQKAKLWSTLTRNAGLLAELIEDLLYVSRLDREKILLNWTNCNLPEILQDVLNQLETRLNAKEMRMQCEIHEPIQLLGDPMRIAQILRIFIDNAIKFSKEGSKIEVKVIDHYQGQYNPSAIDGVLVQVIDEGRGIRKEDIPNLFERFFRSTDVAGIPGTGMGLSIARSLAHLHTGETYVESTYGVGSIFSVFLPRLQNPPK
ncbi:MAG: PAS domain-containing protein [Candidatus Helarchaeota archaeon]|nr:PAS domain-containing protein [Candidatus Helarchaeota archaeon]